MKSQKLDESSKHYSLARDLLKRNQKQEVTLDEVIYNSLHHLRATTSTELAKYIWSNDKDKVLNFKNINVFIRYIDKVLNKFFARGKITKLKFKVLKGRIYGLTQKDCWEYLFKKEYAPERLIKQFNLLIGSKGFVTNVELKELGFNWSQINKWIEKTLEEKCNYIIKFIFNKDIRVYYLPRFAAQLSTYIKSEEFAKIYNSYCLKREFGQKIGRILEDIVEEIFTKKGYEVHKRLFINMNEIRTDVDVFCFNPSDGEVILIECKASNYTIGIGHLNKLLWLRRYRYKDSGKIILVDPFDNIGKSIWDSLRMYPYLRIWKLKKLIEECEKYKPQTYLKIKKEFGDLKCGIKAMTK